MHIVEECGLVGDCLRTGHATYPDGVIVFPLPEGFSARHSCSVQELVQTALLDGNVLESCPEVLCIAFSNMYEEADADWWVDLKLTGIDDVIDLSPCLRQGIEALYQLRACVIHRHSGMASKGMTSGHYIAHFSEAQTWYEADDTRVRACTSLSTECDIHLFPYILFLQRVDVGEDPLKVLAHSVGDDDAFVAAMLEQAPHLEFDATSLRTLPTEDRESFTVAVTRLLDGALVDALSPTQRFNLAKCSRVVDAGAIDSSEEDDVDSADQPDDVLSDSAVAISAVDADTHSVGKEHSAVSGSAAVTEQDHGVSSDCAVAIIAADADTALVGKRRAAVFVSGAAKEQADVDPSDSAVAIGAADVDVFSEQANAVPSDSAVAISAVDADVLSVGK